MYMYTCAKEMEECGSVWGHMESKLTPFAAEDEGEKNILKENSHVRIRKKCSIRI